MVKCDFTVVFYGIDFNAPNQKYDNLMTRCPMLIFLTFFSPKRPAIDLKHL